MSAYLRHTPCHALADGKYIIVNDFWQETQYGTKRSLTIEHDDGTIIHSWLPNSCVSPNTTLIGCKLVKRTIPSPLKTPYYNVNYKIEFE
jgi:hypothetical protein